ncbi:MAG: glycosyltransferase [Anaerosomatales bacterium]|nr:glycosyltransferase [Anaerosomatales bacterium]
MDNAGGMPSTGRLRGLMFAKQFPNDAEPFRGLFTLQQLRATSDDVEWQVIAPLPWMPRWLAAVLRRQYVTGAPVVDGVTVERPRYPVLPKRTLYTTVAPLMAAASRGAFDRIRLSHRPQFVHAHAIYPAASAARKLIGSDPVPLIVSVHGSDLHTNLVRPAWAREVRRTLASAAAVICVSNALADEVRELDCVDSGRVVVIPNAVDVSRFAYIPWDPHDGPVRLVSVGNLVPVKGHDILLRGLAVAVREGLDATLDLVGGGPQLDWLRSIAASEGIADRVTFLGPLCGDDLVAALARADAFVLASRREGFGVAIVEALATGLPVLATRSGGPEDIVGDADGILVAPNDPREIARGLMQLVRNLAGFDVRAIAERAAERYSPDRVGAMLVSVYCSVVNAASETGRHHG